MIFGSHPMARAWACWLCEVSYSWGSEPVTAPPLCFYRGGWQRAGSTESSANTATGAECLSAAAVVDPEVWEGSCEKELHAAQTTYWGVKGSALPVAVHVVSW